MFKVNKASARVDFLSYRDQIESTLQHELTFRNSPHTRDWREMGDLSNALTSWHDIITKVSSKRDYIHPASVVTDVIVIEADQNVMITNNDNPNVHSWKAKPLIQLDPKRISVGFYSYPLKARKSLNFSLYERREPAGTVDLLLDCHVDGVYSKCDTGTILTKSKPPYGLLMGVKYETDGNKFKAEIAPLKTVEELELLVLDSKGNAEYNSPLLSAIEVTA